MNSVSVDIAQLLHDNAFGVLTTNLFAMEWGQDRDDQILVLDSPGFDSPMKEVYENPIFQILVRGKPDADMITAHDLLRSIHEFLIAQPTQDIGTTEYLQYEPISTIAGLGRDKENRGIFSISYFTYRDPI
jgi:hypothetical protein